MSPFGSRNSGNIDQYGDRNGDISRINVHIVGNYMFY